MWHISRFTHTKRFSLGTFQGFFQILNIDLKNYHVTEVSWPRVNNYGKKPNIFLVIVLYPFEDSSHVFTWACSSHQQQLPINTFFNVQNLDNSRQSILLFSCQCSMFYSIPCEREIKISLKWTILLKKMSCFKMSKKHQLFSRTEPILGQFSSWDECNLSVISVKHKEKILQQQQFITGKNTLQHLLPTISKGYSRWVTLITHREEGKQMGCLMGGLVSYM